MAENNESQNGQEGQETPPSPSPAPVAPQTPTRSEQRAKDLADKLIEQEKLHGTELDAKEAEKVAALKRATEAEFKAGLIEVVQKYPQAKEHEAEIKSLVEGKGLTVEEATTLALSKAGKLHTEAQNRASEIDASSFGGSSASVAPTGGEKDLSKMTQEEKRAELIKLEEQGKFGLGERGFFMN